MICAFYLYAIKERSVKTPWEENTIGASTNFDAAHENPNNNLSYYHDGMFWDTPEKFVFPKSMVLKHGWIAWWKGFPEHREHTDERTLIRPVKPLLLMNAK